MSSLTYEAIVFLQDNSDFDIEVAARRAATWLPGWQVTQKDKDISVRSPECEFRLHLADEPFVAEESRGLSEYFAACPRSPEIAKCKRRVEISCADPDPDMARFNDYLFVLHAFGGFPGRHYVRSALRRVDLRWNLS